MPTIFRGVEGSRSQGGLWAGDVDPGGGPKEQVGRALLDVPRHFHKSYQGEYGSQNHASYARGLVQKPRTCQNARLRGEG